MWRSTRGRVGWRLRAGRWDVVGVWGFEFRYVTPFICTCSRELPMGAKGLSHDHCVVAVYTRLRLQHDSPAPAF